MMAPRSDDRPPRTMPTSSDSDRPRPNAPGPTYARICANTAPESAANRLLIVNADTFDFAGEMPETAAATGSSRTARQTRP